MQRMETIESKPIFTPFPSIGQFKDIVRHVKEHTQYVGRDEHDKAIYDNTIAQPIATFTGSVKVHGTNAAVKYDPKTGILSVQSRNHVLSAKSDNCGFYTFAMTHKDYFIDLLSQCCNQYTSSVVAFGEWFGNGIQKGVAVAELSKKLMIFAICREDEKAEDSQWLPKKDLALFFAPEKSIFNITNFPMYEITIDFNTPQASQNQLVDMTMQVEKECPVGLYFGKKGIGEGIVWSSPLYGRFKVKGSEHSSSHTTTLAGVNEEKLASVAAFVQYAVTQNRLEQGIHEVFTVPGEQPTNPQIGKYIKWILGDVIKEETAAMKANNLSSKDVGQAVTTAARTWFLQAGLSASK